MRYSQLLLSLCFAFGLSAGAWAEIPLKNPDFDQGLGGWLLFPPDLDASPFEEQGRQGARFLVSPETPVGYPRLYQETAAAEGDVFEATVEAMAIGTRQGRGVYLSIEFMDDNGRIDFVQSERLFFDRTWANLYVAGVAPVGTRKAVLSLVLHGRGEARFDRAVWTQASRPHPPDPSEIVRIEITPAISCPSLIGFGFEDDGWFYNQENRTAGVDLEADAPIREGRLSWMDPDYVRMFFWHKDWCPSGDWKTIDFDTDNMRSHYESLDLYQSLGTRINVTGVEWGMQRGLYSDTAAFARAVCDLLEHLIREKGYTCIRDWTLDNEPNDALANLGHTFADYARVLTAVKAELARRSLAVNVVGSDDAASPLWFSEAVRNATTFESADLFSSHHYFKQASLPLHPGFFDLRLAALNRRTPRKPFIVGEFGFQDERSGTVENPIMRTYPYALWSMAFAIEGLNRGCAGFSIWCLQEIFYPGGLRMTYGLWDFKDNDWKVRPVYHAWALFTRLTEAGDTARVCISSHPEKVKAARVGETLFWVNLSPDPVTIQVSGSTPVEWTAYTEDRLEGDRECGFPLAAEGSRVELPGASFGYGALSR